MYHPTEFHEALYTPSLTDDALCYLKWVLEICPGFDENTV